MLMKYSLLQNSAGGTNLKKGSTGGTSEKSTERGAFETTRTDLSYRPFVKGQILRRGEALRTRSKERGEIRGRVGVHWDHGQSGGAES